MKICPTCHKTYTDITLNFCLEDGAVLSSYTSDDSGQPTVFMGQAPPTNPNTAANNQTIPHPTLPQINPVIASENIKAPPKKSRVWMWLVGIVGVLVLMAGIGFVGLVALIANMDDSANSPQTKTPSEKSTPPPVSSKDVQKDDFSSWQVEKNQFGTTDLRGGEYIMSSKQNGYYYVLISANESFSTIDATTKLMARNVNESSTNSGYGLIIHSDVENPLERGYAFLIDSTKQSYRVVQHNNKNEKVLVQWTKSSSIRSGSQANEIEVRDQGGKISLYLNGEFAESINESVNSRNGTFGLYVSDAIPIAFSNLRIEKEKGKN